MRMRNCETKMAVAAGSSGKLYRFPPTRELRTDYEAVVPATQRRRKHAKELDDYLRRREEETKAEAEEEKEYPVIVPPVHTLADVECDESRQGTWPSQLEEPLLRQIAALRRALYLAGKEGKEAENGMKALIQSTRESPSATACVLSRHMPRTSRLEEAVPTEVVRCAETDCTRRTLPYSRFCLHHLSGDQDQVLYGSCTGSEPGCGPCGSSVPDFLLNQPLCSKHVTKAALETIVQQQKRKNTASNTSKLAKTKGKGQKNKKTKAAAATVTKLVVTKSSPAVATTSAAVGLPALSSTSSWSSGESEGENPIASEAKRPKVVQQPPPPLKAKDPHQLPSLTPEVTLDLSLSVPMPSLILPPPLPDIGKFMDDSSSEDS